MKRLIREKFYMRIVSFLLILHLSNELIFAQSLTDDLAYQVDTYLKSDRFQEAFELLERVTNDNPTDNNEARQQIVSHYVQLIRETNYRNDGLAAYNICQTARSHFPKESSILTQWGKAALAIGKDQKEVLDAIASSLLSTGNENSDPELTALYQTALGLTLTNQFSDIVNNQPISKETTLRSAVANLEQAIQADPKWFLPHFFLGRAYIGQKKYPQAIQSYELGLKKNPRFVNHIDFVLLASVYNDQKQYSKAKEVLTRTLEKFPNLPGVHYMLAQAEVGMGNPIEGYYQACYELFIGGSKGFFFPPAQGLNAELTRTYLTTEGKQKYPELWSCLEAFRLETMGQIAQAIPLFEQAIASRSTPHPMLHLFLGEAYMQTHDHKKAIEHLKKVIELDPAFPPAYVEIGDLFKETGDLAQAKLWWEKARKIDPNNWKVKQIPNV